MKILFLYPIPDPKYHIIRYHQGLGYLSAVLKKAGHRIKLRYMHRYNERDISCTINGFKPDLVGITVTTNQFDLSSQITRFIYNRYALPVIWGGIHATVAPEESLASEGVAGICLGEGERAISEFVEKMENGECFTATNNFWFKINGSIIKNKVLPFIEDLDAFPFPDREVFNYQRLLNDYPQLEIASGRGCPYNCTYCVNSYLNRISNNKSIRQRSVQNIMAEIKKIKENYYRIETVLFVDDLFAINKDWLKNFSEEYGRKFNIPFWCNARADFIDGERIGYLKAGGCEQIMMGIESGNDRIRTEIMKRNITRERIKEAFSMARKAGLKVWAFNMIGLPGETAETIKETINLNREVEPDSIFCSIFYPYPGTELYDLCRKEGWISNRKLTSYLESNSVLNLPTISQRDISYYYEIFKGVVLYPKLERIIRYLATFKVSPQKSFYAVIRNFDWVVTRTVSRIFPKKIKDNIKSIVKFLRRLMNK